MRNTEFIF